MSDKNNPFNSSLEMGIRSLCLLNASFPKTLDLSRLVDLDYIVLHTGDLEEINGPSSLHPPLPLRTGELLVKRGLIEKGLLLMISKNLIKRKTTNSGIQYLATDYSNPFLKTINSNYIQELNKRANWVIEQFGKLSDKEISNLINSFFDEWTTKFQAVKKVKNR